MQTEEELGALAREEFAEASEDLKKRAPLEAVIRFYARHDKRLSTAIDASQPKPACRTGCWYCCYYKVVARPIEIFAIADFVRKKYSAAELQRAVEEAKANVAEVQGMSFEQHMATNQKCPFLVEQKCSIYPVRPSKCRNFHASDIAGCIDSYNSPDDLFIQNSFVPDVKNTADVSSGAFDQLIEFKKLDSRPYDLNAAFIEAMENTKCAKRFKDGKKAFFHAKYES